MTTAVRGSSVVLNQLRDVTGLQVVAYVKPWQSARTADALAHDSRGRGPSRRDHRACGCVAVNRS